MNTKLKRIIAAKYIKIINNNVVIAIMKYDNLGVGLDRKVVFRLCNRKAGKEKKISRFDWYRKIF